MKCFLILLTTSDTLWKSNRQFNIDLEMIVFKTVVTSDVYEPSTRKNFDI